MTVKKQVQVKEESKGSQTKQWMMGLVANTTILTYSLQSGWMSPHIKLLQGPNSPVGYPLTDYQISIIASSLCVAAVFSCAIFSVVMDKYGRRISLIAVALTQALSWALKVISADPYAIIASQCLCGIASAGVFIVAPLYTKEISQDSIRGAMGSFGMLLQGLGILIMYAMGSYLEYYTVLWIVVWLPILNALLMLKSPESPPYLVKCGRIEEAKETLAALYGRDKEDKIVQAAISELTSAQEQSEKLPEVSVKRIFSDKATRRGFYLGLIMITVLDVGGNYAIFAYASLIIERAGVTVQPKLQSLLLPAIMVVGSMVSTTTIERFGRKPLLVSCLMMTALPQVVLATAILLQQLGIPAPGWISVLAIVSCIFCFGAGVLPIPYVVMSEIFSFQIRAKVMGVYVSFGWFLCFLQTILFTPISQALGMYTMFYIFALLNFTGAVTCIFLMPETKGKSLEQIEKELRGD